MDYRDLRSEFHKRNGGRKNLLDVDWLPIVGAQEWLVITRDLQILEDEDERQALIENRCRVVFLRPGDALWREMLQFVLEQIDWLRRIYDEVPPPFACTVHIAEPIENARFVDLAI